MFGAKVGSTNDKFKFEYMKVQWEEPPNDQGVPEPATMSLMGAALIAVGLYRRRQA